MHIVTGAAGFIGSNMVAHLNKNNISDIVCVDTLNSDKVANLAGLEFQKKMIFYYMLVDPNLN